MIDASGLDRQAQIYGTYKPIDATVRSRRVSDRFRAPTDWMWTMSLRSVFRYSKDGIFARRRRDEWCCRLRMALHTDTKCREDAADTVPVEILKGESGDVFAIAAVR